MLNSSLLKILGSLTPQELKEFKEFVNSPFFNKNENVIRLFNYIKKFHPDFDDKKLEKEYIYGRLFGKEKYNDGFMRTLIFNLTKLAEDYLIHVNLYKHELQCGINLLNELNERKLEKPFLKHYENLNKQNENMTYHNSEYFLNKFLMQDKMEIFLGWSTVAKNHPYRKSIFKHIYENLTFYYLNHVLKEYRYWSHRHYLTKQEFNSEFFDNIISYLTNHDNQFKEKPLIKLHLHEILLQKEKQIKDYEILKNILISEVDKLSHTDRFSLHNVLQIFVTEKIFEGNPEFRRERFELFKIALKQELFFAAEHSYINETFFANVAVSGAALKEFEWVDKFISEYANRLHPDSKDVTLNFCLARISFKKDKFEESLMYLNKIDSSRNYSFEGMIRALTLMNFYELNSFNQIFFHIDTFKHFLSKNKNKLTEERFERELNFVTSLTKLARLKENMNKTEHTKLKEFVSKNLNTVERTWLLEKIDQLNIT